MERSDKMNDATGVSFTFDYGKGACRVILSGDGNEVAKLLRAYEETPFDD